MPQGRRNIDDSIKQAYLEWLLTPPGFRDPETKKAMAERLGVTHVTLNNWEKNEEFQNELLKLKKAMAPSWYAEILAGLKELALHGPAAQRVSASKLLLDHLYVDAPEKEDDSLDEDTRLAIRAALKEGGYQVSGE